VSEPNQIVTFKINERDVSAVAGQTILEVAREHGIGIPTLCNLKGLTPIGACRMCLVEIKGQTKLLPACVTRVAEGMDITTDSPRLQEYRKTIIELLFAERNHVCAVCVSNNNCELQDMARSLGVDPHPGALPLSAPAGGCLPQPVQRRSQPLHPVRALRAGVR
jgi:bidirectional [NiFe] hydrogenase diaphorase subunit